MLLKKGKELKTHMAHDIMAALVRVDKSKGESGLRAQQVMGTTIMENGTFRSHPDSSGFPSEF